MTLLAAYDRIYRDLSEVNNTRDVLDHRDYLDHVKLHARKVQDKALLEEAIIAQMRADRRLGEIIAELKKSGRIMEGRRRADDDSERVTLEDIGVKKRMLSSRAQKAAALSPEAFKEIEQTTREKVRSGGAILVDPVSAATKDAEVASRRAAHAARTMNGGRVEDLEKLALSGFRAGFIGMDPQWHFKTRSDAGEGRSAGIHYKTEEIEKIKSIPVGAIGADDSALGMWTVDWCLEAAFALMRHYGYEPVTKLYTWAKTNNDGELLAHDDSSWHLGMGYWSRANPEDCWLGIRGKPKRLYADVRQLIVAPLMEHSRKPDEWLARSERLVDGPYIELNARRPRKGWLSWGDELEWTGVAA